MRIDDPARPCSRRYAQGLAPRAARSSAASKGAGGATAPATSSRPTAAPPARGRCSSTTRVAETLKLIYDSPTPTSCDNPDNITVTPRGGLLLCEDAAGDNVTGERLIGLTLDGNTFTFAKNNIVLHGGLQRPRRRPGDYRQNEWAGACYSPDGAVAVREHPDAGHHVRDHRPVGGRSAVVSM